MGKKSVPAKVAKTVQAAGIPSNNAEQAKVETPVDISEQIDLNDPALSSREAVEKNLKTN